jgi:hypothetical protein
MIEKTIKASPRPNNTPSTCLLSQWPDPLLAIAVPPPRKRLPIPDRSEGALHQGHFTFSKHLRKPKSPPTEPPLHMRHNPAFAI